MEKYQDTIYAVLTAFCVCFIMYHVASCTEKRDIQNRLEKEVELDLKKTCIQQGGVIQISEKSFDAWTCIYARQDVKKD